MSATRVAADMRNRNYGAAEAEARVLAVLEAAPDETFAVSGVLAHCPWADYQAVYRALLALHKAGAVARRPGARWGLRQKSRWTAAALAEVKRRRLARESANAIAAAMDVSRNAVLGVMHRQAENGGAFAPARDPAALFTDRQLLAILDLRERGQDWRAIGVALRACPGDCASAHRAIIAAEKVEALRDAAPRGAAPQD